MKDASLWQSWGENHRVNTSQKKANDEKHSKTKLPWLGKNFPKLHLLLGQECELILQRC